MSSRARRRPSGLPRVAVSAVVSAVVSAAWCSSSGPTSWLLPCVAMGAACRARVGSVLALKLRLNSCSTKLGRRGALADDSCTLTELRASTADNLARADSSRICLARADVKAGDRSA